MLRNFCAVFKKYASIPVEILLEPLVKQVQMSEGQTYFLNLCDVEFFQTASEHPKLKLK
jgi:hypothetical protein